MAQTDGADTGSDYLTVHYFDRLRNTTPPLVARGGGGGRLGVRNQCYDAGVSDSGEILVSDTPHPVGMTWG